MPDRRADDPAFVAALLDGLPGGAFLLDGVGTILFATGPAASLVEVEPEELVGQNVLQFVDEETAWTYAAAVAMASDYPDVIAGPMRVVVVTATGERRTADLWANTFLDDPVLGGIVCQLTPATSAVGLSEAIEAVAEGAPLAAVADLVVRAMGENPVVAQAAVVAVTESGVRRVDSGAAWMPVEDGPWIAAAATGVRVLLDTFADQPFPAATAAADHGFTTLWAEPVGIGDPPARGALVLWRTRPGRPSPNQLNSVHQAAAILGLAWERHDSSE